MSVRGPTQVVVSEDTRQKLRDATARAWADPEMRARRLARLAAAKAISSTPPPASVAVPWWVDVELRAEYLQVAALEGEHAAARHCRRLHAEMRQPTRAFGRSLEAAS